MTQGLLDPIQLMKNIAKLEDKIDALRTIESNYIHDSVNYNSIKVGTSPDKSSDPAISVARLITIDSNSHGFMDSSIFQGFSGRAYASFDSFFETGGTANLNHIIGFQSRHEHKGTGTLGTYYSFGSFPKNDGGNITNIYGVYLANPIGSGTKTNVYGLYVDDQSGGSGSNYAIYTKNGLNSFGQTVEIRAGALLITHTGLTVNVTRNVSLTTGNITLAVFLAKTSGDMTDGFGSVFSLNVQDNASVSITLAQIGAVRAGADNTGDFIVTTTAAGTATEKLRITSGGDVKINTGRFYPVSKTTAAAPTYAEGAIYYDTTLHKLRVGGASGWETITSS